MRTRWTLTSRLLVAFGTLLLCLVVSFGVAFWMSRAMRQQQADAATVATRMRIASAVQGYNSEMFASERAIIVAGAAFDSEAVTAWHKRVDQVIKAAKRDVDQLHGLMTSDGERAQVTKLAEGMKAWESGCVACHGESADMTDVAMMQKLSVKTEELVKANQRLAGDIDQAQQQQFAEHAEQARRQARELVWLLWAIGGAALLVGAAAVWMVRSAGHGLMHSSHELREGVTQVFQAASQVAAASQSLSQSASEQAASLEEASASMTEVAAMSSSNAEHSTQAADLSVEAERAAGEAKAALEAMVTSMESIRDASGKVAKTLRAVDEIAFQTNILALNAAVEAARAGEAGMGFAVVADEVRSLAQRSAGAAKNTAALIDASLAATRAGQDRVGDMGRAIAAVAEAIGKVRALSEQVRADSGRQAQESAQVSQALEQIEKATQATAATAEESAASSEMLNTQAEAAMAQVRSLEALVGGGSLAVQATDPGQEPGPVALAA